MACARFAIEKGAARPWRRCGCRRSPPTRTTTAGRSGTWTARVEQQIEIAGAGAADDQRQIHAAADDPAGRRAAPGAGRMAATAAIVSCSAALDEVVLCWPLSSQTIFFWFLNDSVAMWPEMAACWPTGGRRDRLFVALHRLDEVAEMVDGAVALVEIGPAVQVNGLRAPGRWPAPVGRSGRTFGCSKYRSWRFITRWCLRCRRAASPKP